MPASIYRRWRPARLITSLWHFWEHRDCQFTAHLVTELILNVSSWTASHRWGCTRDLSLLAMPDPLQAQLTYIIKDIMYPAKAQPLCCLFIPWHFMTLCHFLFLSFTYSFSCIFILLSFLIKKKQDHIHSVWKVSTHAHCDASVTTFIDPLHVMNVKCMAW